MTTDTQIDTQTETSIVYRDLLGYTLKPGDTVAYPTRDGTAMCVAEIIEIIDYMRAWGDRRMWKVRLQPKVYNDYRGTWGYYEDEDGRERYGKLDLPPRQVVVTNVQNLVKVTLPPEPDGK